MTQRILLADDSVTIQKVVELTFMDGDYEVEAFSNGDDALLRLAESEPDLVIADVHMPGASGFEVSRRVKDRSAGVPVLLLVGTFEPFDLAEMEASGADAHLKKPFDSLELLRLVEELSRRPRTAAPPVEPEPEAADETTEPGAAAWTGEAGWAESVSALAEPLAAEPVEVPAEAPAEVPPAEPDGAWQAAEGQAPTLLVADRAPESPEPVSASTVALSDDDIERIARRVIELGGSQMVREVAWEVVPDLAEVVIKDRLRELEAQAEALES